MGRVFSFHVLLPELGWLFGDAAVFEYHVSNPNKLIGLPS